MYRQTYTLGELAELTGSELCGEAATPIERVAALDEAGQEAISFLANPRYRQALAQTRAGAVIVSHDLQSVPAGLPVLRTDNPYLAFARIARLLNPAPPANPGIAASAEVASDAVVDPSAEVGPRAVVASGAQIGARSIVAPGAVIGASAVVGADCRIDANCSIGARCRLGDRVHVNAGAVIGADGFGFARDGERWEAVPQLGTVVIGDDVYVGANTTIDRGSQGDTQIGNGCKIDNLVQIAHNVHLGEHTVIAACSGISGSTRIGRCCTIAGLVGMAGHLEIAAGTTFTGMTMVTGNIREPGVYSSGIPAMTNREWRRNAVRFRRLDEMARRIDELEKALERVINDNDQHARS